MVRCSESGALSSHRGCFSFVVEQLSSSAAYNRHVARTGYLIRSGDSCWCQRNREERRHRSLADDCYELSRPHDFPAFYPEPTQSSWRRRLSRNM